MRKISLGIIGVMAPILMAIGPGIASAAPPPFSLVPFEFVGTADQCGGPAGSDTVTANWDHSVGNPSPSIMLQKLGATSNCASAGVDIISPLEATPVSNLTELNYDYRAGEHCGAGAPRFNLQLNQTGTQNAFLGCVAAPQTNLGNGWVHVEYNAAQIAAAVVSAGGSPASTLYDLYIIFDEGTDTPAGGTIGTAGTIHIDNISVNGQVVGDPTSPVNKDQCKNGGFQNFTDNSGLPFRNQGQCIAFVHRNHNGRKVVIKNHNHITVTNTNTQTATSGNASVNNNTTGGSATSGGASNTSSSSTTITVTNTSNISGTATE
jgi:hypothetical protein